MLVATAAINQKNHSSQSESKAYKDSHKYKSHTHEMYFTFLRPSFYYTRSAEDETYNKNTNRKTLKMAFGNEHAGDKKHDNGETLEYR